MGSHNAQHIGNNTNQDNQLRSITSHSLHISRRFNQKPLFGAKVASLGNNMDKSKIIKLLSLTQSDNDHEALNAIRMANRILRTNEFTWEKFFGAGAPKYSTNKGWGGYQGVAEKIEYILNNYPIWFDPAFVRDLQTQLKIRGKLTPKQVQAIEKIYHKLFGF
jgi:hypothetical protein